MRADGGGVCVRQGQGKYLGLVINEEEEETHEEGNLTSLSWSVG